MYIFRENKTKVIRGKLDGQDYVVQEEKESAKKMTTQQWHEALGHPSPDSLQSNNYSDATNLPKVPKDWQCETCITSKSTKRKPTSITDIRSDTPFELIHSDLSGKFSKTSFGVTILLLSTYATGNDCYLLRKRISLFCTKAEEYTISSDSTELACLSWVVRERYYLFR